MSQNKNTQIKNNSTAKSTKSVLLVEARNISSLLNTLLPLEIANTSKDHNLKHGSRLLRCGLWITRLCHASGMLSWRLDTKKIARVDYNMGEECLYNLLAIEIQRETKLAKNGKYSIKLLHYITTGTQYINNWF